MTGACTRRKVLADDRLEILELLAKYDWAVDTDDTEAFLDVFTADGQFVFGDTVFEGTGGLREFIEDIKARKIAGTQRSYAGRLGRSIFHNPINVVLEWDGDDIRLRAELISPGIANDGQFSLLFAWYDDRVTRVAGEWKFRRRHATLWSEGPPRRSGPS